MNNDENFDFITGTSTNHMDRREFLKLSGGGIFILFNIGDTLEFLQARQERLPNDLNAFLRIGADGRVSCYTGKIEMGQGIHTSLGQMLADELDVSLDAVEMVMGDTDLCPWDRGTFGSQSTRSFGPSLRAAGAEARSVLVELASEHLKVPRERLVTENGAVIDTSDKNRRVTYGELANGKKLQRKVSGKVAVKKPSEFNIIGKSFTRRDSEDKVTGKAQYAGDIQLPGMLHAKILRLPSHDARLIDVDVSPAQAIDGVQVVKEGNLVAVLHKYPDVAEEALTRIKARYSAPEPKVDDKNVFDHFLKIAPEGRVVTKEGNLQDGEHESATVLEETYYNDYVSHAPMEPHTASVHIDGNKVTVWASTQTPFRARDEVAKELGVAPENVRVITPYVGGGFGGKSRNLQVVEAARLAKLTGKPVQVAWSRKEEFFYDTFRPAALVKIKSGITDNGGISLWDFRVYFAGERGSQHFYRIPHHSTVVHGQGWTAPDAHPFATGAWRAPSNNTNTFARESQIDIMAGKVGIDPVEFRMQNLKDEKMLHVLKTAAEKFGWKPDKSPSGKGRGVACGIDAGTYVASMAEVEVDKKTGKVQVKRVLCVQNMGLVINPAGATIQMEGCIMMGLGYSLTEGIHFKGGEILDLNFDTYQIPRFSWMPKIETFIIDNKETDPQGGGEPAIVTMGAVIANAIYDATGARLHYLPMTPERVMEAMKKT